MIPLLASLRAALDQPVFPGKMIVWLLFMLSIVGWVAILSKAARLRQSRRADLAFTERLRKSKTTLEVYEEGREDEASLKHLVYQAGARETAYQLLGSREPRDASRDRIRQAGRLSGRQLESIRMAFQAGFRDAVGRLGAGIEALRGIAAAALLLGVFGFVWALMKGFDEARDFTELAPKAGGALGCLAISLLVAGPAILVRYALREIVRKRTADLERFRDNLQRLFERSFAAEEPIAPTAPPSSPTGETDEKAKRYHSIRDRLLRADEGDANAFQVNPIARQAASAGGALRGY